MGLQIGLLHVRRSIWIQANSAEVWQQFASEAALAVWFGRGHRLEQYQPGSDGHMLLSVEIDGEQRQFGGRVLVWEPEVELSVADNWLGGEAWSVPTALTFRLTPLYDGVLVELFHHGFERLGAEAGANLEGYESGWDLRHLSALKAIVESSSD